MNHIYDERRCIFCNANDLDVKLYNDDEVCEARDPEDAPYVYTSETGIDKDSELDNDSDPINPVMEIDLKEFFSR